jgi:hypothetical protein
MRNERPLRAAFFMSRRLRQKTEHFQRFSVARGKSVQHVCDKAQQKALLLAQHLDSQSIFRRYMLTPGAARKSRSERLDVPGLPRRSIRTSAGTRCGMGVTCTINGSPLFGGRRRVHLRFLPEDAVVVERAPVIRPVPTVAPPSAGGGAVQPVTAELPLTVAPRCPDAEDRRFLAICELLDAGRIPGRTVAWGPFHGAVLEKCRAQAHHRRYGLRTIQNLTRQELERRDRSQ